MASIAFDTHQFVKRLKDSGFTEAQAEVITDLQRQASAAAVDQAKQDYHLEEISTKRDLEETEAALKHDLKETEAALKRETNELAYKIELLRAETKQSIAEAKADLIRWVVGAGILQTAVITALLLKLANQI